MAGRRKPGESRRGTARRRRPRLVCECGGVYELARRKLGRLTYEVYACPKCRDTVLTREQARVYRQVHALAQVARKLEPLTLRRVGNSVNATVPKELTELGFDEGRRFRWEIESLTRITLHVIGGRATAREPAPIPLRRRRPTSQPRRQ